MAVWGEGLESDLCCCLASGGSPGARPISSHFTHAWCVTGALPVVVLVLNSRVGGYAYVLRPCRPFKRSFLKIQSFFHHPTPTDCYSWKSWRRIFPALEPWAVWSGLGLGSPAPKVLSPDFYPPHVNVGPPMPIPLLPLCTTPRLPTSLPWLHVSAPPTPAPPTPALPTRLDKFGFFKSLAVALPYSLIF